MMGAVARAFTYWLATEFEVISTDRTNWIAARLKAKRQNGIGC
jgi:hypothetical protein